MLDFLAVAIVLGATLVGYLRGILRQALSVAAVIAACAASSVLGWPIASMVTQYRPMSPGMAYTVGRVIAAIVVFASLSIAVALVDKRFGRTRHGVLQPWNRNFGALAGLLFGLVLALILLCVADAAWKALPGSDSTFVQMAGKSRLRTWITGINPTDQFLVTDTIKLARLAKQDPKVMEKLKERPEIQELIDHPAVQDVLTDEDLMAQIEEFVQSGDLKIVVAVARHEKIRKLLSDSTLRNKLLSPQTAAGLSAAVEEAEKEAVEKKGAEQEPE